MKEVVIVEITLRITMQNIFVVLKTVNEYSLFNKTMSCGYFETFEQASKYITYLPNPDGHSIVEAHKGDITIKEQLSARSFQYEFSPIGMRKIELIPYLKLDQLNQYQEHNPFTGSVTLDADSGTEEELKAKAIEIYEQSKFLKKYYSLTTGYDIRIDTVDVDICLDKILFLKEIDVHRDFSMVFSDNKIIAYFWPTKNMILIPYMDNNVSADALRYIHEEFIEQNKACLNQLFLNQFKLLENQKLIDNDYDRS